MEVTDIDVAPHDVVLKDLSTGWFETLKDAPLVVLELAPELRGWLEYYPTETVNRDDSGRQTGASGHRSRVVAGLLLRLAGGARVLSPVGAGDSAADAAWEALDQYDAVFGG